MSTAQKATYRRLGKSGLKVSVPILGCMSFGTSKWIPWVLDTEDALPILKAAYDAGVTTWDTACNYSHGASESTIGRAIQHYSLPREKLIIMTKCYGIVFPEDQPRVREDEQASAKETRDYVNQCGLSRASIYNSVEGSLKRLGTNYIDLLQIHRFDYETPPEETMCALNDLVRSGKVRYIGASSMWTWQFQLLNYIAEKHGWTQFVSMQNQHSLLYREEEREMLKYCEFAGIGVIPWGPLRNGDLGRPNGAPLTARGENTKNMTLVYVQDQNDKSIIDRVEEVAEKKGWKMAQVALTWSLTKVTSPIIGLTSVDRLEDSLCIADKQLTQEDIAYLEELYKPKKVLGHI